MLFYKIQAKCLTKLSVDEDVEKKELLITADDSV